MRFASLDDCLAGYAALYEYDAQERKRLRAETRGKFTPHERYRLVLLIARQRAEVQSIRDRVEADKQRRLRERKAA